ncbi:hypothetical protein [Noviluteimonas dokdonensis]|uniref:hypothetical protein n=1 Tax=Noviluteimonas dokdonensis TaxID=414050 RepID=UPI00056325BF|nr:hypothetical protein [Lysobacter dokdonensis]
MNIVAWMDEKHAWRSPRAPTEPGTYALVLADDYDALLALVRECIGRVSVIPDGGDLHDRLHVAIERATGDNA